MQSTLYFPTLNALLNGTSAVLLLVGHRFIKRGEMGAHKRTMLAALTTSALFLASYVSYHAYLYYHANNPSHRFSGPEPWRTVYLTILGTHTLLAIIIVPLILITLARAFKGRFAQHRAVARWTYPMWLYVSVTGVIVYLMLYVIFG